MTGEGIEVDVYRWNAPTVKVKTLHGRKKPQFVRQFNAQGAGSIDIPMNDPEFVKDPTLLDYRNILKFKLDNGVQHAIIIKSKNFTTIDSGEDSAKVMTVSGPGLRGWLNDAILYPTTALSAKTPDNRSFNWTAERGPWYDSGAWFTPYQIGTYGGGQWGGRPANWPDKQGKWIWGANVPYPGSAPDGARTIFRYEVPIATEGTHRLYFAADDWVNVWIDGAQVVTTDRTGNAFTNINKQDTYFTVGTHYVAFEVINAPQYGGNPAGLLVALYRVDSLNNEVFVGRSSADAAYWKCQYQPSSIPGWTAGAVMRKLITEAIDRGVTSLTNYTIGFTDTVDSDGVTWPQVDWQFDIGTNYTEIFSKIEEFNGTLSVDPTNYTINYHQTKGVDRSVLVTDGSGNVTRVPVILNIGKNLLKAGGQGVGHLTNNAMLKTADGWSTRADATSTSAYGRIEETIDASELTAENAQVVADYYFSERSQPEEGATYELIPVIGAWPLVDFFEGDWVKAPDMLGNLVKRRVMSISVGENESTGAVTYTIEFDTIFQDMEQRLSAQMKKLGGGGGAANLAGTSLGNNPVNPPSVIGGGPAQAPVIVPEQPTGLSATSVGKWMPNGVVTYSEVTLSWSAVTGNTDGSETIPQFYDVQAWRTSDGAVQQIARVTSNTAVVTVDPNIEWNFQVRAVNENGQFGNWSDILTYTPVGPTTPMDPPTTPTLSSSLGLLSVTWDGLVKPSSPIAPPPQFRYTRIEVTPHGGSTWQQMGSVFQRGGGTSTISDLTVGQSYDVRLVAIDGAGIASAASGIATITLMGVDLGDLDSSISDAIDAANNAATEAAGLNGLVLDSSFEDSPLVRWTLTDPSATQVLSNYRTGAHAIKLVSAASAYMAFHYNEAIQIDVGDTFLLRAWLKAAVSGALTEQGVELGLFVGSTPDPASMTTFISVATNDLTLDTTYTKISGSTTIPAGNYRWAIPAVAVNDTTSGHTYYLDDLTMFQMTDSDLIVDGSVTADALAADSVIAGKIAAGAVDADQIRANAVTAEKLAADSVTANAIAAGSITGDKIVAGSIEASQLSPSVGNDIDISANDTVTIIAGQAQTAQDSADANADNLTTMQTYYAFGSEGAVISKPGSPFQLALRSDRIEMLENGNVVSYWNSGQMHVNDFVGEKVILGNHQIEKYGTGTVVRTL